MGHQPRKTTLGVIVGNRGFFPSHLAASGRETIVRVLREEGIEAVIVEPEEASAGSIVTLQDAKRCAELFRSRREDIDGILITLPNFGEERGIADTLKYADLRVPILVHAFHDEVSRMTIADRRDSFCGKMSVCSNLRQYGFAYSLTTQHTVDPESASFRADLQRFAAVCRTVKALHCARLGAIGARPAAFNTVRYSEILLERSGISVETLDLSELFGRANRLTDQSATVRTKREQIDAYVNTKGMPEESLQRMARLGAVIDGWMSDNDLVATAIQCWTSMEEYFGVAPCAIMSMMSNSLLPSACETDVPGLVGMYALQAASGRPSALLDWNNNYGDDPDKGVVFHCSNLPKDIMEAIHMDFHEILAGAVGKDKAAGTINGRIRANPFTYLRVSTDDLNGTIRAYTGEGQFTNDPLLTFGGYGVVRIERFQQLLRYICENGFEHHVAANVSRVAPAVEEALGKYMGWSVYRHGE
ncbi:MAG: L-fucose/L-arabinose isomerase family protein [Paenibacillaceae bacterium]|nr:L-fucose/L-arabinose isomerase family protein [Paenibacillaceae bacterium]